MAEKFKNDMELQLLSIIENQHKNHVNLTERVKFLISHGLRQPISQIIGMAQLINKTDSRDELETMLAYIKHSAENLDMITKELMGSITESQRENPQLNRPRLSRAS